MDLAINLARNHSMEQHEPVERPTTQFSTEATDSGPNPNGPSALNILTHPL